MNKIKNIMIVLLLMLFVKLEVVDAVSNVCEYDKNLKVTFDEAGKATINQDFYGEAKTPWIIKTFYNKNFGSVAATENLEFQIKELIGSCPKKLYVCKYEQSSIEVGEANKFSDEHGMINVIKKVYIFSSKGEMEKNSTLKDLKNNDMTYGSEFIDALVEGYEVCSDYSIPVLSQVTGGLCAVGNEILTSAKAFANAEVAYAKYKDCFDVNYTGDGPTYNLACPNLNVYLGYFNNAITEYKKCSKNDAGCLSKSITNVNEKEDLVKNYCKSIMAEYSYDGSTEQDCLNACFDIGVQLSKAKKSAGLLSEESGDCGFSARLMVWISNILRWIKYILPVIVIVLGILDFIKAIAGDKDDEMKKAQGKFIKRLIAAALVFIIPLIIEFVLDKMGFGYNDCGLF